MLQSLMATGHPIHLALVDAYLGGAVRAAPGTALGGDSRAVIAGLAGPLTWLYECGVDSATLLNLVPLPSHPLFEGSWRYLIVPPHQPHRWLHCASTTPRPPGARDRPDRPATEGWNQAFTTVPELTALRRHLADGPAPAPIDVRTRESSPQHPVAPISAELLAALRAFAFGRAARAPMVFERAIQDLGRAIAGLISESAPPSEPELLSLVSEATIEAVYADIEPDRASIRETDRLLQSIDNLARTIPLFFNPVRRLDAQRRRWRTVRAQPTELPPSTVHALADVPGLTRDGGRAAGTVTAWEGLSIDASCVPESDGNLTLALLPRPGHSPRRDVTRMGAAAWLTLEGLLGTTLSERQSEPITLRLVGPDRATELAIGWSLVLPRNRRVFAAWLGSDGRVVIRLRP